MRQTRKNAIAYDTDTFMTSIPGVFAGGDCGNDKISIAIEAIADARKAADSIDAICTVKFSNMKTLRSRKRRHHRKDFEDRERERPEIPQLSPEERKDNFSEVIPEGPTEEQAEARGFEMSGRVRMSRLALNVS